MADASDELKAELDADGDGEITKKEFRAAMARMGLDLPPKVNLILPPPLS